MSLARAFTSKVRRDPVLLLVLGLGLLAVAMRLVDLDAQALHHDESLHATFAWYLAEGRGYVHDPLMHGPLQFHVMAAFFTVFGDSDAMARVPHALAGSALVFVPLLLRRWLGGAGTVAAAALLALSPTLLYYSRFARNDIIVALWTLLLVIAVWRYLEEGRMRWLILVAAMTALSFATKETAYLTVALLLLYLEGALVGALLRQRGTRGARRLLEGALLLPTAWLVAALWRPLVGARGRLGLGRQPRAADLIIVMGTVTLPFLAAAVRIPLGGVELSDSWIGTHAITLWIVTLLVSSLVVGLLWDWRRFVPIAVIAAVIIVPLFTTSFTNVGGLRSGFWGQLDYWLDQQDVQRGNQPAFYYLMLVPLYEFLTLLPAIVGGLWLLWRRDGLGVLLVWWLAGTFIALTLAGEKMPWLSVHIALPLALVAAYAVGRWVPPWLRALRGKGANVFAWSGTGVAVAAVLLVGTLSVRGAASVAYGHPDTAVEPLIYTQTTPDVPLLAREIREFVESSGGEPPRVIVDRTASLTWPWAWYLRDLPGVSYESAEFIHEELPEGAVLISTSSTVGADSPLRAQFERSVPYRHRWWFPEGGYRAATFGSVFGDLLDGSLLRDWANFVSDDRIDADSLGTLEGEVFFPAPRQGAARPAGRR